MFCVVSDAEKINVLCLQTMESHSSVKQLLLLIIYIVIALQRHHHGAWLYYVSCYTNIEEKDDFTIPYGQYAKLPKVTMICL